MRSLIKGDSMMDCSLYINFLAERERMCRSYRYKNGASNKADCGKCKLHTIGKERYCANRCENHPLEAIKIVQEWSNKNPVKTRKTVFLQMFPNATIEPSGVPSACAGDVFGFACGGKKSGDCVVCWSEVLEG